MMSAVTMVSSEMACEHRNRVAFYANEFLLSLHSIAQCLAVFWRPVKSKFTQLLSCFGFYDSTSLSVADILRMGLNEDIADLVMPQIAKPGHDVTPFASATFFPVPALSPDGRPFIEGKTHLNLSASNPFAVCPVRQASLFNIHGAY